MTFPQSFLVFNDPWSFEEEWAGILSLSLSLSDLTLVLGSGKEKYWGGGVLFSLQQMVHDISMMSLMKVSPL